MTPEALRVWIKAFVTQMETSYRNPYQYSFSTGDSGLSYGAMQNDVAVNTDARISFNNILLQTKNRTGLTDDQIASIVDRARHGGKKNDFAQSELDAIDSAFQNAKGLVDARDEAQLNVVVGYVNQVINSAAANPNGSGHQISI